MFEYFLYLIASILMTYMVHSWLQTRRFNTGEALGVVCLIAAGLAIPNFSGSLFSFLGFTLIGALLGLFLWMLRQGGKLAVSAMIALGFVITLGIGIMIGRREPAIATPPSVTPVSSTPEIYTTTPTAETSEVKPTDIIPSEIPTFTPMPKSTVTPESTQTSEPTVPVIPVTPTVLALPTQSNIASNSLSREEVLTTYNNIFNQEGWCVLWQRMIEDELIKKGNCPTSVLEWGHTEPGRPNLLTGIIMRASEDIEVSFPACVTFGEAQYTGGTVKPWIHNDSIGTNNNYA